MEAKLRPRARMPESPQKIPPIFWMLGIVGAILIAPVTFFAFYFGGSPAGAGALLAFALAFVVLYFFGVRRFLR